MPIMNYSPEEIVKYVEMPEMVQNTILKLLEELDEQNKTIESLQDNADRVEDVYAQLEEVINSDRFAGNEMIPELITVSKALYNIL
jgi:hypothetical protein